MDLFMNLSVPVMTSSIFFVSSQADAEAESLMHAAGNAKLHGGVKPMEVMALP